jgi:membrane protein
VLPIALDSLGLARIAAIMMKLLRWPALFVVVVCALALLYRLGPSRPHSPKRWITAGCVCAALIWLAASVLFSWYATNFGNYNATYGSLGAVIGFMIWMWLSIIVVLLGAELDADMERHAADGQSWP